MANLTGTPSGNHLPQVRSNSEKRLGILHFTSFVDFGWRGDIRKRYTDFIVHEVRKNGSVVYLLDADVSVEAAKPRVEATPNQEAAPKEEAPPKRPREVAPPEPKEVPKLSQEEVDALEAVLGSDVSQQMQDAFNTIVTGGDTSRIKIVVAVSQDRTHRSHVHQEIRRIFNGRFETQADPQSGAITAVAIARRQRGGRSAGRSWRDRGDNRDDRDNRDNRNNRDNRDSRNRTFIIVPGTGKYLHFTLYKENKDTMEAINHLARMLKIKSSNFGFAGTKDRRAATTQRVSVWRHGSDQLGWLNGKNNSIKVGDFSKHQHPIQLGQHGGNEFVIVIKNVELTRGMNCSLDHRLRMTEICVQTALNHIQKHGFINYFGLQRFGTHSIGTHEVGQKILGGDFEGAVEAILFVESSLLAALNDRDVECHHQRDEINRARAIAMWKLSGDLDGAMEILPKRFSAESTIMRHLGRSPEVRRDFCGAILKITRGLRNLYIHAYQSYVWNWVNSMRWSKYGDKVIVGDLVLVESEANPARFRQGEDMSEDLNQDEEQFYQQARALTEEDVASGNYTIYDIVLPVPGFDMMYPNNDIAELYTEFMGRPEHGGLNPYEMRRPQKEFSLSGHYRKILARFSTVPKFFVRPYLDDSEQMHPTDLDEVKAKKVQELLKKRAEKALVSTTAATATADSTASTTASTTTTGIRRRRSSPDGTSETPETRVNDAWVETNSDGGSKRIKVEASPIVPVVAPATPLKAEHMDVEPSDSLSTSQTNESAKDTKNAKDTKDTKDAEPKETTEKNENNALPSVEDVTRLFNQGNSPPPTSKTAGSNGGKTSRATSPPSEALPTVHNIQNVFKSVPVDEHPGENDGSPAINLTSVWKEGHKDMELSEDMKIAVALNFRLSSSNYATICLREMMSSVLGDPEPASTTNVQGQTTSG